MRRLLLLTLTTVALIAEAKTQPANPVWVEPVTQMEFISIEAGCFQMGNPNALEKNTEIPYLQIGVTEPPFADEAPVHEVCVDSFQIGRYEVTVDQWQRIMPLPDAVNTRDNQPVAGSSWVQVQEFINQLNQQSTTEQIFRLPTEAEWEYACRAGAQPLKNNPWHSELAARAWYSSRMAPRLASPSPVGQLEANPWQLHDMLGNVWEWTQDSYHPEGYLQHSYKNPVVESNHRERVIRGGSFRSPNRDIRCSSRGYYDATQSLPQIGFRLVRAKR